MADVALDLQNSNPKELFGQGVRAYVLQDFDNAVRAFSKVSELLSAEHGSEIHDSLGDVYLYYGKSLLELARKESGPLGDGVLKNVEGSESEDIEEDDDQDDDNKTGDEDKKTDDEDKKTDDEDKKAEDEDKKVEDDDKKIEDVKAEEKAKVNGETSENSKETKTGEDTVQIEEEAGPSTEIKESEENEEELTDLQVAWEVLELAKRIFTTRGSDGKKNLAETLIVLGEISLESGNFPSAIEDMVHGLEIQKTLFGNDSRTIAETYYKLGGAYSTNGQIDDAISSFNSSYEYLTNKINTLKKDEANKEANAEEIEELKNLIPEVQEKIADMKNLKVEVAKKVVASASDAAPTTNGTPEPSSSKQVNDISHLVKRKRKEENAESEENPAKKPSP